MDRRLLLALRRLTRLGYRARGTGIARLCEALRKSVARRWDGSCVEVHDFMGGLTFSCDLGEHMGSQIFWRGHYSGAQLSLLPRWLTPGAVFIDVGANHGEFTVYAASLVGPRGRVIAFEPLTSIRERLLGNVRSNGFTNVTVVPAALADRPGTLSIYSVSGAFRDGTQNRTGLATLFPDGARNRELEKVAVERLDDAIEGLGLERVDAIKLDIEGAEFSALRGAEETLRRYRPALIFELSTDLCRAAGHAPRDLLEWVAARGYRLLVIEDIGRARPLGSGDEVGAFQNVMAVPAGADGAGA